MFGLFSRIAPSQAEFTLVCTRAKSTNHWVTKKDDLFNVGPVTSCFELGMIAQCPRLDWEGIVDARVSPQLEIDRAEGHQTQRSQGGREEGHQAGAFHRSARHCAKELVPTRLGNSFSSQLGRVQLNQTNGGERAEGWGTRTTSPTLARGMRRHQIYSNQAEEYLLARPRLRTTTRQNRFVRCVLGHW